MISYSNFHPRKLPKNRLALRYWNLTEKKLFNPSSKSYITLGKMQSKWSKLIKNLRLFTPQKVLANLSHKDCS